MNNRDPKIKKILNTLSEGSESLRNDDSIENRREWEDKIEQAGNSSNWTLIIIIGIVILVLAFSFTILSGAAVVAVSNSPITSNSTHPSDAVYFNNHYYKNIIYPSSIAGSGYETTKSYAVTTCNDLNGYIAVITAGSIEEEFMGDLYSQFEEEHPGASWFICEWDN